jgi:hypothetical protein
MAMASDLTDKIFHAGGTSPNAACNKISVIGAGNVGAACAFAILMQVSAFVLIGYGTQLYFFFSFKGTVF